LAPASSAAPASNNNSPVAPSLENSNFETADLGANLDSLPPELAGAARASANADHSPASLRAAHAVSALESVSSPAQLASIPPVAAPGEASAFAHGGAAAQLPPAAAAIAGASSLEPFAVLDGDAGSSAASSFAANSVAWIRTGAHSVEAGFEDPSLGWVGVRADLGVGGVHAAVVPGSAEAAQALGSQMAGLHAYLNDQRTPLGSLTLAAPEGGASYNSNQGEAGNQQNPRQGESAPAPGFSSATGGERSSSATQPLTAETRAPLFEHAGAYISVMA
jgi:hypothetical protein